MMLAILGLLLSSSGPPPKPSIETTVEPNRGPAVELIVRVKVSSSDPRACYFSVVGDLRIQGSMERIELLWNKDRRRAILWPNTQLERFRTYSSPRVADAAKISVEVTNIRMIAGTVEESQRGKKCRLDEHHALGEDDFEDQDTCEWEFRERYGELVFFLSERSGASQFVKERCLEHVSLSRSGTVAMHLVAEDALRFLGMSRTRPTF
jgi:hypothetical protein